MGNGKREMGNGKPKSTMMIPNEFPFEIGVEKILKPTNPLPSIPGLFCLVQRGEQIQKTDRPSKKSRLTTSDRV